MTNTSWCSSENFPVQSTFSLPISRPRPIFYVCMTPQKITLIKCSIALRDSIRPSLYVCPSVRTWAFAGMGKGALHPSSTDEAWLRCLLVTFEITSAASHHGKTHGDIGYVIHSQFYTQSSSSILWQTDKVFQLCAYMYLWIQETKALCFLTQCLQLLGAQTLPGLRPWTPLGTSGPQTRVTRPSRCPHWRRVTMKQIWSSKFIFKVTWNENVQIVFAHIFVKIK